MLWVEGLTLNTFVEQRIDKPNILMILADKLIVRMGEQLRRAAMAHGDLQHGNILLVPKDEKTASLKLVDYDGMFVPALAHSSPNERGHANFQHPGRLRDGTYDVNIDRFPLMVIYCALHSLACCGPTLWERYNNDDNLLFREADFQKLNESALLQELWYQSSPKIKPIVGKLILTSERPIGRVPLLEELIGFDGKIRLTDMEVERVNFLLSVPKSTSVTPAPFALPSLPIKPEKPSTANVPMATPVAAPMATPISASKRRRIDDDIDVELVDPLRDDDDGRRGQAVDVGPNGLATASMIMGLISIVFGTVCACVCGVFGTQFGTQILVVSQFECYMSVSNWRLAWFYSYSSSGYRWAISTVIFFRQPGSTVKASLARKSSAEMVGPEQIFSRRSAWVSSSSTSRPRT